MKNTWRKRSKITMIISTIAIIISILFGVAMVPYALSYYNTQITIESLPISEEIEYTQLPEIIVEDVVFEPTPEPLPEPTPAPTEEVLPAWSGSGSFKSFMDFRTITDTSSRQFELQRYAWTNDEGIRCIGDYRMIALGSGHHLTVGDKVTVYLISGEKFIAIVGEMKDDSNTLDDNVTHNKDGSIIEFIVDDSKIDPLVMKNGSFEVLDYFSGGIKNIVKLEEGDETTYE